MADRITFKPDPWHSDTSARASFVALPGGVNLRVRSSKDRDAVEVVRAADDTYIALTLTAEQARALPAELTAAAQAADAAKGVNHG